MWHFDVSGFPTDGPPPGQGQLKKAAEERRLRLASERLVQGPETRQQRRARERRAQSKEPGEAR